MTRIPAQGVMPPGMAGKKEFQVDGEQITYDPEKAKELLAEAGYGDKPYPITMVYYEVDPLAKAGQDQITKGFEASGFTVNAIPVQESPYNIWLDPGVTDVDLLTSLLRPCPDDVLEMWPVGTAVNSVRWFTLSEMRMNTNAIDSMPMKKLSIWMATDIAWL